MRRISPRHCASRVQVRSFTPTGGWLGGYGDPRELRAQVEQSRHLTVTAGVVNIATVLTIRVPPSTDGTGPTVADFPTNSEVLFDGELSWVVAVRTVRWHGVIAYLELTTGDRPPLAEGGWVIEDAVLERAPGRDRRGNPVPGQDVPLPVAVLRPVKTSDPSEHQQPDTTAEMLLPPDAPEITSTDRVRVPSSPMAGLYQVDGHPLPSPARTLVQLRRI